MSTNSTLNLTSDQAQLLSQMFGDLASLDYDDKYNDDFGSDVFNQLWERSLKCDLSPFYFTLMEVSSMSVITNQLDCLSEVLEDFCTKYNLEFMSADDILYSHQYAEID